MSEGDPHRAAVAALARDGDDALVRALASHEPFAHAAARYLAVRDAAGWPAARRRGRALEQMLGALLPVARRLLGVAAPLDLLLRGSGGHGIPTRFSDVDFEVSGPQHPHGHRQVERAIEALLVALGIDAEGSSGRPAARDLAGAGGLHRDLHEWMELRRVGSRGRDVGWLAAPFAALSRDWWRVPSAYEREGRRATPKYAFFEARALASRLSLLHGTGAGTTQAQLQALRRAGLREPADVLTRAIATCFELYERPQARRAAERLASTQAALHALRERFALPGPDLAREAGPDTRRASPLAPDGAA